MVVSPRDFSGTASGKEADTEMVVGDTLGSRVVYDNTVEGVVYTSAAVDKAFLVDTVVCKALSIEEDVYRMARMVSSPLAS